MEDMTFPQSEPQPAVIASVSKALDVLEVFSYDEPEMRLGEIALKLKMGKSSVHKVLKTLLVRGFVTQNPSTRRYRLGLRNWQLGALAVGSMDIREVAAPYLRRLSTLTGEQLTLWVYESGWAVCIDRVDSRYRMRTYTRMGTVEKPEDFASGRCLLAFSDDLEVARATARLAEARGQNSAEALIRKLNDIRDRGYETNSGDLWEAIRAIAAPFFSHSGVAGAITVAGLESRFDEHVIREVLPHLLEIVKQISTELGYISREPMSNREGLG